jgi:hypothetical protein
MSSDFTKILVKDDRMECVDNIKYAVIKGGQNVTPSQFRAISTSNNQLVFNIQVPSEQTLIDRRVLLQTDLQLVVKSRQVQWRYPGAATGDPQPPAGPAIVTQSISALGCGLGSTAGLAPYPLHSMMTVASATINNNTVSINMKDVLPAIIRMLDKKELGAYNGMSATATDSLQNYSDQFFGVSPSTGCLNLGLDTDMVGRGSVILKNYTLSAPVLGVVTETFTWHLTEALMLSPFIYSNPKSNGQAFYGIQNMNIVLNIGSDLTRAFRGCGRPQNIDVYNATTATYPVIVAGTNPFPSQAATIPTDSSNTTNENAPIGVSLPWIESVTPGTSGENNSMFANTFLLFTFLTAHPSDLFPARNIVPYYELPRYITTGKVVAPLNIQNPAGGYGSSFLTNLNTLSGGEVFTSQTLQLNQIPDKLIVYIRKQGQSWADSDSYLPITGISINFNNNSGILSASRTEDLYRMSKDNGSNQSWNEWVGYQQTICKWGENGQYIPAQNGVFLGTARDALDKFESTYFFPTATVGGCLVLEFGKDIQLIEDFFAPGSLGNFNIQVQLRYQNNNQSLATGSEIEMVMITMNSGVFVCERGTSSTYTGILTRADVLEASEQDAYTRSDVQRLVGGGFLDMLKSGVSKLAPLAKMIAPHAKEYLMSKGDLGKAAAHGMSALGYGASGGGASGGRLQGRYA